MQMQQLQQQQMQQAQQAQQRLALLQLQQLQQLQRQYWERLFLGTLDLSEAELRAALKHRSPDRRFAAAYVVGEKLLEWQDDLIPLLQDRSEAVRQAARRGLIILSFLALNPDEARRIRSVRRGDTVTPSAKLNPPVDFGPEPGWKPAARSQAVKKWKEWWTEQKAHQLRSTDTPVADAKETEGERLGKALLQTAPVPRQEMVARYRDSKGVEYTEALAYAVARESGQERLNLRMALDERMKRMKKETLGRYLEDEDAEIRRAAILVVATKGDKAHVDALTRLLLDPQPAVGIAAHVALCSLSGQDFGPRVNATEAEKTEAAAQWRRWWQEQR